MEPLLNSHRLTQFGPQPVSADAAPLDLIFIEGFRGETVIGIHESELHRPQPLVIDLQAGLARAMACSTDHIADTIDYGVVRSRLQALMQNHGVTLLEALAEKIAQMLLVDFRAAWVKVKVVKPHKFDDVEAVGVMIERTQRDAPAAQSGRSAQVLRWIGSGMVPERS
ncbi:MAG: dihydroneopterin aldolase [Burkholderiales bacterium]|nr:dihydroneopterin aldolase [Burkholderiales bacterium]